MTTFGSIIFGETEAMDLGVQTLRNQNHSRKDLLTLNRIKTSQSNCSQNQFTGFYLMGILFQT